MIGDIYKKTDKVSAYQPSKEVRDFTSFVKKDYEIGDEILNKPYVELNNMSVLQRKMSASEDLPLSSFTMKETMRSSLKMATPMRNTAKY